MAYMTRNWIHAKDRSLELMDAGFARHLRAIARPSQIAYTRMMGRHHGDPTGIEFRHQASERWAFVLPDVSEGGFRIQDFDSCGFTGHQCYATLEEAVQEMISQGFRIEDAGALDRAARTQQWAEGMSLLEKHTATLARASI